MKLNEKYDHDGFVLVKGLISKDLCKDLKEKTKDLKPKLTIPFTNIAWGYGDVRNESPFDKIAQNDDIIKIVKELINCDPYLSHFLLVNKAAWVGPDVEWHQEVFNMDMYAPGIDKKKDWNKFIQTFIAIDDHSLKNGCLKVFKSSHKAGILNYEDIVNVNGSHKRRVTSNDLDELVKNHEICDVEMESGDALFFNHLIVHGSPSNLSPTSRLSALLQFYDGSLKFDTSKFENYRNFRTDFIRNHHSVSISKLDEYKVKLNDFKK